MIAVGNPKIMRQRLAATIFQEFITTELLLSQSLLGASMLFKNIFANLKNIVVLQINMGNSRIADPCLFIETLTSFPT
jgi:hypothetical protein